MDYMQRFENWKTDGFYDAELREELEALDPVRDEKEIEDRFYCDLEFGTGGLRGVMGAGTNRMNRYTVGKASKGLGEVLLREAAGRDSPPRVAICHDTRENSLFFARTAAQVLSGMGIDVFLQEGARPTPQLSFAVRHLNCSAGVVITASHNPKEYNGYKVYDRNGCQMVPEQVKAVSEAIRRISDYREISFAGDPGRIHPVDVTDAFIREVRKQSRLHEAGAKQKVRIVYTPLHGTGLVPVLKTLREEGFDSVYPVEEQTTTEGTFPTVKSPNPEERTALEMGIQRAGELMADVVIGTDPDCDRVGVAVLHDRAYRLLTGNQMGALLTDYVLSHTAQVGRKPAVVKTVVTNELGAEIARRRNVAVFETLTGFKYIGEKICQFEAAKAGGDPERDYDFLFGYEESFGYLAGTHARDKDAVVSSLLICEMAAAYKAEGKTLIDRLEQLYREYGYYHDALDSYTLKGKDGQERIRAMMESLRKNGPPFSNAVSAEDFNTGIVKDALFGPLPKSDVLKYTLADGSWVAVRPSGTEPKIKIYYSVRADGEETAAERLDELRAVTARALALG